MLHAEADSPSSPVRRELAGCVSITTLYRSPVMELIHWRCLLDDAALRREREHAWPVLGWTDAGASVLHRPQGSTVVEPTTVILHQPLSPYRTTHPYGCGDEGCNLAIRPELVDEARERLGAGGGRGVWPAPCASLPLRARLRLFALARRLRAGLPVEPLDVEEAALRLLEGVMEPAAPRRGNSPRRPGTSEAHLDLVERVKGILVERLAHALRLGDIAREAGASPFHLARVFREVTGLPVHEYLTRLRLLSTLPRAMDTPGELTRLALDAGFSSHSHFTVAFRRRFAVPPSQVRQSILSGELPSL